MSEVLLRNTTPQVQEVTVRDPGTRKFHNIQVRGLGQVDIDFNQVTPDVRRKVDKGIFKAYGADGNKIEFTLKVAEDAQPEAPAVNVPERPPEGGTVTPPEGTEKPEGSTESTEVSDTPEGSESTDGEGGSEEFKCDVCGEEFQSSRALSSHKRAHK